MKKGWQIRRLGDVCEIIKGRKPVLKAAPSNGDLPYLVAKVMRGSAEAEFASIKDRNSVTVTESETIIICDGSNSGEVFTGFQGILSSTMGKISKKAEIDGRYLRAFLASTFEVFNGAKTGAAIPHLDKEAMYQLEFPLPPVAEQQRIVDLLDEAFAGIAAAKVNTEKNLQNARALFESHLTEALSSVGKSWPSRQLDTLLIAARKISYGIVKPGIHDPAGVRLIKSQQVRNNSMDLSEDFRITRELDEEYARTRLHGGEILLNLVGASIGRSAIAPTELKGANVSRAIAVIPVRHEVAPWVQYNLRCSVGQTMIQAKTGGAAQPVLNLSEVKSMAIPFPPPEEQNAIVKKLDALETETQRLARLYEKKLAALEGLKKSLLHQAFTGDL